MAEGFEAPPFLIEGWLPLGGRLLVHGVPGACKTHFALSAALAVASGGWFLNTYPCRQGKVAFLQLDMGMTLMAQRVKAAKEQLAGLPIKFWVDDTVMLDPRREVQKPRDAIRQLQEWEPDLVVLDCFDRIHVGNENESKDVNQAVTLWTQIFRGSSIMFVHHDRKPFLAKDGSEVQTKWDSRGSIAGQGRMDAVCQLRQATDPARPEVTRIFAVPGKIRGLGPQPAVPLILDWDEDTETGTLLLTMDQETVQEMTRNYILGQGDPHGVTVQEVAQYLMKQPHPDQAKAKKGQTIPQSTAYRNAKRMLEWMKAHSQGGEKDGVFSGG